MKLLIGIAIALLTISVVGCSSTAPDDSAYPIQPSQTLIETGRPIYQANCAGCHGDGATPPRLPFVPSHGNDGHTWHHPDRSLVGWILDGTGQPSSMPAFRGKLTESEVRAVLAYIKSFWSDDVLARQLDATEAYEEQVRERGTPGP